MAKKIRVKAVHRSRPDVRGFVLALAELQITSEAESGPASEAVSDPPTTPANEDASTGRDS